MMCKITLNLPNKYLNLTNNQPNHKVSTKLLHPKAKAKVLELTLKIRVPLTVHRKRF